MPTTTTTEFHICSRCNNALPPNSDNFYIYPNGRFGYCRSCCTERARLQAAARRGQPRTTGRKFGVELEFVGDRYSVARELNARGVGCSVEGYNHFVTGNWKVVTDASVSNGGELVSPPLKGAAGRRQLKLACEALEAAGARVTLATGLHVHHDVSDLNHRAFGRFFRFWMGAQPAINTLVSRSRRNGRWAMPLTPADVAVIEGLPELTRSVVQRHCYTTRYKALNVQSYGRYGTVEVRQHQGTMNADKILAWVDLTQAMITWAKSSAPATVCGTRDAMLAELQAHGKLKASTAAYLNRRAAQLAGSAQVA